ncbi:hypothetical protein ACFZDJ_50185 [Streptomyces sp. NPDC007896]|uniref:hypothetical protein n=1 Tax=unclassified Streptomyces TaxID=2593676 RepID=UPI0036EEDBB2
MLETPGGFTLMSADTPQGLEHSPGNNVSASLSDDDWKLRADRSRRMLVKWTYALQWSCLRRSRTGVGA